MLKIVSFNLQSGLYAKFLSYLFFATSLTIGMIGFFSRKYNLSMLLIMCFLNLIIGLTIFLDAPILFIILFLIGLFSILITYIIISLALLKS